MWIYTHKLSTKCQQHFSCQLFARVCDCHWRKKWHPTPVLLPGKSHGQRSLVGYSPWGRRVRHDWATSLHSLHTLSLEKEMPTHSTILAWRIPWTEEPGRPWFIGLQRVGHAWSDWACTHVIVIKPGILTPAHTHTVPDRSDKRPIKGWEALACHQLNNYFSLFIDHFRVWSIYCTISALIQDIYNTHIISDRQEVGWLCSAKS